MKGISYAWARRFQNEVVVRPCDTAGIRLRLSLYNNKIARFDLRDSQC